MATILAIYPARFVLQRFVSFCNSFPIITFFSPTLRQVLRVIGFQKELAAVAISLSLSLVLLKYFKASFKASSMPRKIIRVINFYTENNIVPLYLARRIKLTETRNEAST